MIFFIGVELLFCSFLYFMLCIWLFEITATLLYCLFQSKDCRDTEILVISIRCFPYEFLMNGIINITQFVEEFINLERFLSFIFCDFKFITVSLLLLIYHNSIMDQQSK